MKQTALAVSEVFRSHTEAERQQNLRKAAKDCLSAGGAEELSSAPSKAEGGPA